MFRNSKTNNIITFISSIFIPYTYTLLLFTNFFIIFTIPSINKNTRKAINITEKSNQFHSCKLNFVTMSEEIESFFHIINSILGITTSHISERYFVVITNKKADFMQLILYSFLYTLTKSIKNGMLNIHLTTIYPLISPIERNLTKKSLNTISLSGKNPLPIYISHIPISLTSTYATSIIKSCTIIFLFLDICASLLYSTTVLNMKNTLTTLKIYINSLNIFSTNYHRLSARRIFL